VGYLVCFHDNRNLSNASQEFGCVTIVRLERRKGATGIVAFYCPLLLPNTVQQAFGAVPNSEGKNGKVLWNQRQEKEAQILQTSPLPLGYRAPDTQFKPEIGKNPSVELRERVGRRCLRGLCRNSGAGDGI
jgi:hypothetical protein